MQTDALTASDLDAALALSRQAGWNQNAADWRRLLEHPDARCFAGRVDGELVATSSTVTYDGRVCWIGMVLVDADHRRRGYGTAVVERALDDATATAEAVGLDATDAGRPLYRDLGFVDVTSVERWSGVTDELDVPVNDESGDHATVERASAGDLDRIAAFDAERCGVDRRSLLRTLLEEPRTTGFRVDDGGQGYAVLRPGRECWQLGPVVADSRTALEALLASAATELGDEPVLVDVLREDAGESLADAGLSVDRTLTRMSYGRQAGLLCGDAVYAAAGLELG